MYYEKAAGPIEKQYNKRLKQYCCKAITKIVSFYDGLTNGIWFYALFISAIKKIDPLIRFKII